MRRLTMMRPKKSSHSVVMAALVVVTLLRFERRTYCLEGSCSIQLSYGAVIILKYVGTCFMHVRF